MKTTSGRSKLMAWVAVAFGFAATVPVASAQDWYYINRQPASLEIAQAMGRGLPFGYYWLQPNGIGDLRAAPTLSETSTASARAFQSAGDCTTPANCCGKSPRS